MGVFIGIIIGITAGLLYNRYHDIKLPDYLGFFGGRRFVPIITSIAAIFIGVAAGYYWHYAQNGIDAFSNAIIGLGEFGTFIYGTLNRLLIPLGLHHILNSVFWFQLGDFHYIEAGKNLVAHGDLHRFFAGDKTAGTYMSGFYPVMMFGLPALALAMYLNTPKSKRKKVGAILAGVAFTSFLTGITEPMEFLFLFAAPLLFLVHALLTGLSLALAQMLGIHDGFGFSAGFIDYIINYKLATKPLLLIPLGIFMGFLYFIAGYAILRYRHIQLFKEMEEDEETQKDEAENKKLSSDDDTARKFIEALGGSANIVDTDACITRLRMTVKDSAALKDEDFSRLGAAGVIRPDNTTIQVVLGPKAEKTAEAIRAALSK
jgi:PTS system N-acetylglucosamine-specific IIC component